MAQPRARQGLRGNINRGQSLMRRCHLRKGHDLILFAMDQLHWRLGGDFRGQAFRRDQAAGKTDQRGAGLGSAQQGMQGHHGSLAEANDAQRTFIQAQSIQLRCDKGIEQSAGIVSSRRHQLRVTVFQGKPLEAERIDLAGLGRVGCDEHGFGKERRQQGHKPEEIIAICAVTMQ